MTSALITGGSGFLGTNLIAKLLQKDQDVKIYDISPPPKDLLDKVTYIEGDIRDKEKLETALQGVDIVYHAAALIALVRSKQALWDVNVTGTEIVAQAALKQKVKKLVYISSSAVYDLKSGPVLTETSPINRNGGAYAWTKYQGELIIQKLAEQGLPAVILRPGTVVGSGRVGIFQILYDWIMRGKRVYIIGKGNNIFQLTSASDLCNACILAAESSAAVGKIFNIGADQYDTLKETLHKLIIYAGTSARIQPIPVLAAKIPLSILYYLRLSPLVPWHYNTMYKSFYLDITQAREVLGWQPMDSNQDMLIENYDWYVEHHKELTTGTSHSQAPDQKILKWLRKIS